MLRQYGKISLIRGMRKAGGDPGATERIRSQVRARFALSDTAVIVVAEQRCLVPGCPPVETVATFWDDTSQRYRIRIFKPLAEVGEADLPPGWLLPGLADDGDETCGCC